MLAAYDDFIVLCLICGRKVDFHHFSWSWVDATKVSEAVLRDPLAFKGLHITSQCSIGVIHGCNCQSRPRKPCIS